MFLKYQEGVAYIKAGFKVDMRFPYVMEAMQMQTPPHM